MISSASLRSEAPGKNAEADDHGRPRVRKCAACLARGPQPRVLPHCSGAGYAWTPLRSSILPVFSPPFYRHNVVPLSGGELARAVPCTARDRAARPLQRLVRVLQ